LLKLTITLPQKLYFSSGFLPYFNLAYSTLKSPLLKLMIIEPQTIKNIRRIAIDLLKLMIIEPQTIKNIRRIAIDLHYLKVW
jgi:hypothetical protein